MVPKKRSSTGKKGGLASKVSSKKTVRRQAAAPVSVVPAKTADVLSVLENSRTTGGIAVGHIVEAVPVCMDPGESVEECFMGEVVAIKWLDKEAYFYIHFLGEDSRMDDWLPISNVLPVRLLEIEKRGRLASSSGGAQFFSLSNFSATASAVHSRNNHIKSIRGVQLGNSVVLKAWYPSPYPEMISCVDSYVKVCDTCLSYFRTADELARHWNYCGFSHPPGTEIYRDEDLSVFEIDGESYNGYGERLLLLSKLFLEEKRALSQDASQYAQVRTFHFYVACRWSVGNGRAELVGYFSKLKNSNRESHILSCILVFPHEQRKGYGSFLIDFAYELAQREGRIGSAERPLSDLGKRSFYPYWIRRIVPVLKNACKDISISELAKEAGIVPDDVLEVLKHFDLLKEWGKAGSLVLLASQPALDHLYCSKKKSPNSCTIKKELLHWTPSYTLNP